MPRVNSQATELQQQLASLLGLPVGTPLQLLEPPLPSAPDISVNQAVIQAVANSPEVEEARNGVAKAHAGRRIARLSYLPAVDVVGGYIYQDVIEVIDEDNIGFIRILLIWRPAHRTGGHRKAEMSAESRVVWRVGFAKTALGPAIKPPVRGNSNHVLGGWEVVQLLSFDSVEVGVNRSVFGPWSPKMFTLPLGNGD